MVHELFLDWNNAICHVSYYQMDHVLVRDVQKWLQELFPVLSLNTCMAWWKEKINIFLTVWSEVTVNSQLSKRRLIQNSRQRETKNCQEDTHFSECILVKLNLFPMLEETIQHTHQVSIMTIHKLNNERQQVSKFKKPPTTDCIYNNSSSAAATSSCTLISSWSQQSTPSNNASKHGAGNIREAKKNLQLEI